MPPRNLIEIDYSFWHQWTESLPDVREAPALPDPELLERFCLSLQVPETDISEDQMDAFEKEVCGKVQCMGEGLRPGNCRSDDATGSTYLHIGWIPVRLRESVVAQVLDILRRYSWMDQVQ